MTSKKRFSFIFFLTVFFLFQETLTGLSYSEITENLSGIFYSTVDDNEGQTSFRSLLIPFGGRSESLGGAFTGLSDDISYLKFNPGAGAIQKETQFSLFHNTWIADSKLDSLAYTTRLSNIPNLSYGGYISCFYLPFTEYNLFGDRVAGSYYSETVAALNLAYNFLAGYDFKGFALGVNIKTGWRSMPDYTDNNTDAIIANSGLQQSALSIMGDVGLLLQFNFLKYYYSREPNVHIGLSVQNLGVSITGFGANVIQDDPLPTLLSGGISLKFLKPLTLSMDFSQPVNLSNLETYLLPYINLGVSFDFADFLSLMAGISMKGANPRFSAGFEFEVAKLRFNFNYSLDFTSSLAPFNRLSLSTKILMGDKGRSIIDKNVDDYYQQGLIAYADADYEGAIELWNEALKLNKRFDPAILGIQSAQHQIDMFKKIKESLMLD